VKNKAPNGQDFELVLKEDFDGDEYFKYDIEATYDKLIADKKLVVIVEFRGAWCPYCKTNLQEWNQQNKHILASNGILIGLSSQHPEFSKKTAQAWGVEFPLLGDPENIMARKFGMYISKNSDAANGFYPYGMAQAGVVALDENQQQIYYWRSEPTPANIDGATDRPEPKVAMRDIWSALFQLQRSDSELSLDTSMDSFDWDDLDTDTDVDTSETDFSPKLSRDDGSDQALCEVSDNGLLDLLKQRTTQNRDFARHVIEELGKSRDNLKLYHTVRKQHRAARKQDSDDM
jgi:peroxiredoxin